MRYIIFSRVSKQYQQVESQMMECRAYVEKHRRPGDKIIEFEEPETSSRIPMENRKKLQEMLSEVRRGDTLVIYKLDRIARSGGELVYIYLNRLIDMGVKIVSLYEPHIDRANIHIYAFLGETERNNIRIRTISGLKRKQAAMEKVGTAWYGYKTDDKHLQIKNDRARSYMKPYRLIPDDYEQSNIAVMLELKEQGLTYGEMEKEMNSRGRLNRKGNPFQKTSIWRILARQEKINQDQDKLAVG